MYNKIFSQRLQLALNYNKIKPIELAKMTGIDKSQISCYLSGNYKPSQTNIVLLAQALNVTEAWLLGFSDQTTLKKPITTVDELQELFYNNYQLLNDDDRDTIKYIIEKRIKENDTQR